METATSLRRGMFIRYNGTLHLVIQCTHSKSARGVGFIVSKLRNMASGNQVEYRWRSDEKYEEVELDQIPMEFLYQDGDQYCFMNNANFEQVMVHKDVVGEGTRYLVPNTQVKVFFFEGNPIEVRLPSEVVLAITETGPNVKGSTVTAATKPATCETGLVVQVPLFLETGEKIIVYTEDGSYISRAKEK